MRHKHGGCRQLFECEADNCERSYARKDARLKHYRKHHPERVTPQEDAQGFNHVGSWADVFH